MSTGSADSRARQQHELDQEQTLVDLDQSIAEREQVRADRDQQRLDEAQVALDADSPGSDDHDRAAAALINRRQAELGLAQDRSDAHQTQLDDNQRAQDLRRNVLDEQQAPLDHPANAKPSIPEALPGAAQERDRALHRRAVAAVARPSRRTSAPTKRSSAWKHTRADKKRARRWLVAWTSCPARRSLRGGHDHLNSASGRGLGCHARNVVLSSDPIMVTDPSRPTLTSVGLRDEQLMRVVSAGSVEAFGELYDRYCNRAYGLALSVCRDDGRAQDAVQEAFLSVWNSRASYQPRHGTVAAWLLTVVRHRAIDLTRRSARHDDRRTGDEHLNQRPAPDDVCENSIRRDAADRLRASLDQLPDAQQAVITLAYYGQLSHTEIATHLGLPPGTVKGRMRLGLQKLRADIEAYVA